MCGDDDDGVCVVMMMGVCGGDDDGMCGDDYGVCGGDDDGMCAGNGIRDKIIAAMKIKTKMVLHTQMEHNYF